MINPWWIWHCSGNLEPKNDPYSDDYDYPFLSLSIREFVLISILTILYLTVLGVSFYFMIHFFMNWKNNWSMILFIPAFILMVGIYTQIYAYLIRKI